MLVFPLFSLCIWASWHHVKHAFMFQRVNTYHTPIFRIMGIPHPSFTRPRGQAPELDLPDEVSSRGSKSSKLSSAAARIGRKAGDGGVCWMGTPITRCPPPSPPKEQGEFNFHPFWNVSRKWWDFKSGGLFAECVAFDFKCDEKNIGRSTLEYQIWCLICHRWLINLNYG